MSTSGQAASRGSYGLTVFSGGYGPDRFRRAVEIAQAAEQTGFDTVWAPELYDRSATVPMTVYAQGTRHARIGSNIAYGVGRTPLMWAAEARDLDELSAGRVILGLGNGTTRMMADWHGVDGEAPALRMEELVEVLRKLWRLHADPVHHDGRFYRLHITPTSDTPPPYRERLPVWTAGVNSRMVQAAGQVADGVVGHPMFTSEYVTEVVRPALRLGAAKAGRNAFDIAVMGIVMCAVGDDVESGRRRLAYSISQYAASKVYDRLFELHGWGDAQLRIREAAKRRDIQAMTDAVPAEAIDAIAVACPGSELAARVAEHAADYDHLDLVAASWGLSPDEAEASTVAIVEAMRGRLVDTDKER